MKNAEDKEALRSRLDEAIRKLRSPDEKVTYGDLVEGGSLGDLIHELTGVRVKRDLTVESPWETDNRRVIAPRERPAEPRPAQSEHVGGVSVVRLAVVALGLLALASLAVAAVWILVSQ